IGGSARKRRRKAALLIRRKKHNVASETAVEKPLGGKVPNQTFPPSLQIAQKARDSHFPTAATTAGLRLHFQCLDGRPQGYIFKWLDAGALSDWVRRCLARDKNKEQRLWGENPRGPTCPVTPTHHNPHFAGAMGIMACS